MKNNYNVANLTHTPITAEHLTRRAVYLRQSAEEETGSRVRNQNNFELARAYGWPEVLIGAIDNDRGKSGFSIDHWSGWHRMLANIANNAVGIVFTTSIFRLTRKLSAYEQLVSLAADHRTLLCIDNRIIDPSHRSGGTNNEK